MAHLSTEENMSTKPDERELFPLDYQELNSVYSSSPVENTTPASHDGQLDTSSGSTQDALSPKPKITLYFMQSSRAIRIAWLLEELALKYELIYFDPKEGGAVFEEFESSRSFYLYSRLDQNRSRTS